MEFLKNWLVSAGTFLTVTLLPLAIILVAGILLVQAAVKLLRKGLSKTKLEPVANNLIVTVFKILLYGLLCLILASKMGLDVTGIVALASVLTLAISLAVQTMLTNVISGFTLLYTRPFHAGDFVEVGGQSGTVKSIGLTYTELTTPDNKNVFIPNSAVTVAEIVNYTVLGTRRVEITITASYDSPIDGVLDALKEAAQVETRLPDKEPFAAVKDYGESAIVYVLHVWSKTADYWTTLFTINQRIKEIFDAKGLSMTYPHLNVHLDK